MEPVIPTTPSGANRIFAPLTNSGLRCTFLSPKYLQTQFTVVLVRASALLCALVVFTIVTPKADSQTFTVLHVFGGSGDGAYPNSGLVRDSANNFYGTTEKGGTYNLGTIFEVSSSGVETVLYSFGGASDGQHPAGSLLLDRAGNIFGTASGAGQFGYGTVFELDTRGNFQTLYAFDGISGKDPDANLVADYVNNLYGTTSLGGTHDLGTIFRLDKNGTSFRVIYNFGDVSFDGFNVVEGLVLDPAGTLYGTASSGGSKGYGTAFQVDASGIETVLKDFNGGPRFGGIPLAGLLRDTAGNLYGTVCSGGINGEGTIFKINVNSKLSTLHNFNGEDGACPKGGLIRGAGGSLYGTTSTGGTGAGVIYKLTRDDVLTVLHTFNETDGKFPQGSLVQDASGNLYGMTNSGAMGYGEVFKITPN